MLDGYTLPLEANQVAFFTLDLVPKNRKPFFIECAWQMTMMNLS